MKSLRRNTPLFQKGEVLSASKLNWLASSVAGLLQQRFGFGVQQPPNLMAVLVDDLPADPGVYSTGTISAGSDQLTTSEDLSGYADDYVVVVPGAGDNGTSLEATITSATSSVATLGTTASTSVTDVDIGVLAVADAYILERAVSGRLIQRVVNQLPEVKQICNDFQHFGPIEAGTRIEVKFRDDRWVVVGLDKEPAVILTTDLDAADDYFASAAELPFAWARYVMHMEDGSWQIDSERDPVRLFNRRENISFVAGTPGSYKLRMGVLQFYPDDCGSIESSSLEESFDLDESYRT